MCATRLLRISAAKIGPNRFHQNRTVSWLMSIPRPASRSSTLRSESGYLTYVITARRMTSGELLKYRNRLLMAQAYNGHGLRLAVGLTLPPRRSTVKDGRVGIFGLVPEKVIHAQRQIQQHARFVIAQLQSSDPLNFLEAIGDGLLMQTHSLRCRVLRAIG